MRSLVVFSVILVICSSLLRAQETFTVERAIFEDRHRIPLCARHRINGALPREWGFSHHITCPEEDSLWLDQDGDGEVDIRIDKGEPVTVALAEGPSLVVYYDRGQWWCYCASAIVSCELPEELWVLDADASGTFGTERDYVSYGSHGFAKCLPPNRILIGDRLHRYAFEEDDKGWKLSIEPIDLDGSSKEARQAVLALNKMRSAAGLVPVLENPVKSAACEQHARYLFANSFDFSAPWDGVGCHDQIPGNPESTEEGRVAAQSSLGSPNPKPGEAVEEFWNTALHRAFLAYSHDAKVGVGFHSKSRVRNQSGYCVLWGEMPKVSPDRPLIVVPAPGQKKVPRMAMYESPEPEDIQGFYQTRRGFPISVAFDPSFYTEVSLSLYRGARRVPCYFCSPEKPLHSSRPDNTSSAILMADSALKRRTMCRVVFQAKHKRRGPVEHSWQFYTE